METSLQHEPHAFKLHGPEAIILAGGLGTRLRDAVPDLPKCMAPVAGRPFLYHVITYLQSQGIRHFIFSLGYKHEVIETWLHDEFPALSYECVIESEPLGTGGAIRLACRHAHTQHVVVTNGDTLFRVDIPNLQQEHERSGAVCTLALKPMQSFDRYGSVEIDETKRITGFREKQFIAEGLINGGLYVLDRTAFDALDFPEKFSFETAFLEPSATQKRLAGFPAEGYFIDIGIPADFQKAQADLVPAKLHLDEVDQTWTLFLDRDGVINEDKPGSYIFSPEEFRFMHGAPALFQKLAEKFGRIIVATNQRGVGKKLMTEETLTAIHDRMKNEIVAAGGKLDHIYYATATDNRDHLRKPNPGMALAAKSRFPEIDLKKSIMIGNNISDMQFGRSAGMFTVFLTTTNQAIRLPHPDIDLIFNNLLEFTAAL